MKKIKSGYFMKISDGKKQKPGEGLKGYGLDKAKKGEIYVLEVSKKANYSIFFKLVRIGSTCKINENT